jgi:hypothetical protein
MGSDFLDKERIKRLIQEELDESLNGDFTIDDINVDIENSKVKVTFGLSVVEDDDYIGLYFY